MIRWVATLTLLATPAAAQQIFKTDGQNAVEGEYLAFASPWCKWLDTSLREGRDYQNSIAYQAGTLPNGVQITWRWPAATKRSNKCGVYGYNFVAWGNYDGGATPLNPIKPRQVKDINDLTFAYGVDYAADPAAFNGLIEFYLTSQPQRADLKQIEIGWFWQAPPTTVKWAAQGRPLGDFTDRYGKRWSATANDAFVTFVPASGSQLWGTIDAKGALDYLRARGLVSNDWWFNGAAIGVEPLGGFGTAIVRHWKPALR